MQVDSDVDRKQWGDYIKIAMKVEGIVCAILGHEEVVLNVAAKECLPDTWQLAHTGLLVI